MYVAIDHLYTINELSTTAREISINELMNVRFQQIKFLRIRAL